MAQRIRKKVIDEKIYLSPIITKTKVNGKIIYTKHYKEFREALRGESLTKEDSL